LYPSGSGYGKGRRLNGSVPIADGIADDTAISARISQHGRCYLFSSLSQTPTKLRPMPAPSLFFGKITAISASKALTKHPAVINPKAFAELGKERT
jgi:hypothetical protein